MSAVLKSTDEVTQEDFVDSDGIIAGSPVYFGVMAAELKKVLTRLFRPGKRWRVRSGQPLQRQAI